VWVGPLLMWPCEHDTLSFDSPFEVFTHRRVVNNLLIVMLFIIWPSGVFAARAAVVETYIYFLPRLNVKAPKNIGTKALPGLFK